MPSSLLMYSFMSTSWRLLDLPRESHSAHPCILQVCGTVSRCRHQTALHWRYQCLQCPRPQCPQFPHHVQHHGNAREARWACLQKHPDSDSKCICYGIDYPITCTCTQPSARIHNLSMTSSPPRHRATGQHRTFKPFPSLSFLFQPLQYLHQILARRID